MSVEEAKRVTAAFPEVGFVPPPRAIDDITAILDQQKPDESYRIELLNRLNRAPPPGAAPAALANHFRFRAEALAALGRFDEAEAAARESIGYAKQAQQGVSTALSALAVVHQAGYGGKIEEE